MTKRKSMTPKRRRAVAERHNWRTPDGSPLALERGKVVLLGTGKAPEINHVWSLGLGGPDTLENLEPLAPEAHAIETKKQAKARGKVRRLSGANKPKTKRKIQSRGFDKRLRKKMDGTVEAR